MASIRCGCTTPPAGTREMRERIRRMLRPARPGAAGTAVHTVDTPAFDRHHSGMTNLPAASVVRTLLLTLCLSAVGPAAARAQDLVGLYLTWDGDPTTTATINWIDLYPDARHELNWREVGATEWAKAEPVRGVVEPSSLQRRTVRLTGLKPDTTYEFGIGRTVEKPTDGWRFRTLPATLSRPIRFVSGGDTMHTRALFDAMKSQLSALDPDFAILGGDLAYEDGAKASRFVDWFGSWLKHGMTPDRRLIPMVVAIGNHEVRGGYDKGPAEAPYFYRLFTLPGGKSNYALDFGDYLSILALDSGHTQQVADQAAWLNDALAVRAKQTYLFPVYHYPAYGTTKAPAGKTPLDSPRAQVIRQHWTPLFDKHGVSAVFENDHHNYKRTVPIRGEKRDDANGIVYLGDGAWGVTTRDVPKPGEAWWLARAEPRNHVWVVDLAPGQPARVRAIDPKGEVFDEFTLPKQRTTPAR
jgi:hypothetical protein